MLHRAVENDEKSIVEKLIQQWPEIVNVAAKDGRKALSIACSEDRLDLVQVFQIANQHAPQEPPGGK